MTMSHGLQRWLALPVIVASATLAQAADFDGPGPRVYAPPRQIVARSTLVPHCEERFSAELLHCQPRTAVPDEDAYAIEVRRKSMLSFPRRPYPQLFSWDYP